MGIFKKGLAVFLAALMLVSVFSVMAFAADETNYFVAGVGGLCGNAWSPADPANQMTLDASGVYTKTYENVTKADEDYAFKVTDGTWDNCWGANGDNFLFNVTDTCDVTITFDPVAETVNVTGENVVVPSGFTVEKVYAVGDPKADTAFLNGISWDPAADANEMTEISENVYAITYYGVGKKDDYGFKFTVNGSWNSNFGALKDGNADGESLQWDGDNIKFDVEYDKADVTLTLDLTAFDYDNGKTGAKYAVDVVEAQEETTEPATATPDETEPASIATQDETQPASQSSGDEATDDQQPTSEASGDEEDVIVPGFYVVGSEEVCGAEWGWDAPWKYGKPMSAASDGTYFQVATNVPASAGNITDEGNDVYVFKVVYVDEDGGITWHPGGMGNNTVVTVAEDNSTILFQFKLLASKPTKEGSDPEAVIATVYGPNDELPDFTDPQYPTPVEETTAEATTGETVAPTEAPTEEVTVAPTEAPTDNQKKDTKATKKKNTLKVKAKKTYKVKAKTLKKKSVKIKIKKVLKVTKAKGKVTYAKVKKGTTKKIYKKIKISKKSGKITLKKGKYAKKTYKIKIKVKAAGTKSYKAKTIKKTIKIKVK